MNIKLPINRLGGSYKRIFIRSVRSFSGNVIRKQGETENKGIEGLVGDEGFLHMRFGQSFFNVGILYQSVTITFG